jgi:hypothetical protein
MSSGSDSEAESNNRRDLRGIGPGSSVVAAAVCSSAGVEA